MYHPFCRRIRKVKTLQFTVMLLIMIAELSCCQGSTSAELVINFKVPKGWKRINDSVFVRTNYEEEFRFWYNDLREGHMPWRGDPKNIAVTCLWSFGIHDGSPVWVFANRLTQVKKNKIYSLRVDSTKYIIYIRTKKEIPIAYKFIIK